MPLLDLGVHGKDHAVHKCQLLWAPATGTSLQRSKSPSDQPLLAFAFGLSVRFSHWKFLWLYSSMCISTVWGNRESRGWSYCFSSQWCHTEGRVPPKKDGICGVGKWLSIRILAADLLALSPKLQTPDSPYMTLVYFATPTLCQKAGWVAENDILCIGLLRGCLVLWLSLSGGQKPSCFSEPDIICSGILA